MQGQRLMYVFPKKDLKKNSDWRNYKRELKKKAEKYIEVEAYLLQRVFDEKDKDSFLHKFTVAKGFWETRTKEMQTIGGFVYTEPNDNFLHQKYFPRIPRWYGFLHLETEDKLPIGFHVLKIRTEFSRFVWGSNSKTYPRLIGKILRKYKRNLYGENILPKFG